jgi:polysaccharide biosynthesis protein PslG
MSRAMSRRVRRYVIATVIAMVPLAILCAYVSNLLAPTSPLPRPVSAASYNIVETASINDDSTTIGVADSDLYNASKTEIKARFDEMEALGVDTVRVIVPWGAIRPAEPGSPLEVLFPPNWDKMDFIVEEAQERGFAVLGVLNATPYYGGQNNTGCLGCPNVAPDPTDYAAFAAEVAERYQGQISAYEIWNEPNSYRSWSPAVDPVAYTRVLKAAYTAIKGADPDATVVAGVLGAVISVGNFTMDPVTFVKTMYANGAKGYFDALSYHPYNYQRTFAEQNPSFLSPLQMLLEMRQTMLNNGDDLVKIWATEYGLPTSLDTDQEQAYQDQLDFIRDFLNVWGDGLTETQLAQLPAKYRDLADTWEDWIGPAFIYTLRDRLGLEATEQGSLGLFYFDETTGEWTMKPAGEWIKDLIEDRGPDGGVADSIVVSLQKLVQAVASSIQTAVQTQVAAVQQAVSRVGTQIGNALANAVAAWAAAFKTITTTTTRAAIDAVDSTAIAETAVAESFGTTAMTATEDAAASGVADAATQKLAASEEPAAEEASSADTTEEPKATTPNETAAEQRSSAETTEEPKATTPNETATETKAADVPASEEAKTTDDAAAADDKKTTDEPKTTAPANRKDEDEVKGDSKKGDSKKGDSKKSDGDKGADGETAEGKHAQGTVKNGTSVNEIKTKLGEDTATTTTGTPKHAAAGADASASAAG